MKNCYKLEAVNDKKSHAKDDTQRELALITSETHMNNNTEIWYADSGANSHMTYSQNGLYNLTRLCKTIIVGNGEELECKMKGDLKLYTKDGDGRKITAVLTDVLHVPRLRKNLCSLSKITDITGTKVHLNVDNVVVQKEGEVSVKLFSRKESRNLYNMECTRKEVEEHALFSKEKTDIDMLHRRLGHPCYEYTKKTASLYGVMWKGVPEVCAGCAMGKGHQKAIKKNTENRAKKRCEGLFVVMVPDVSLGGSKCWILIVDDATRFKWSYFVRSKDEILDTVEKFLIKKLNKHDIRYLRCDNAGENKKLSDVSDKYGIQIEYTTPNTPQQNGVVERSFAIIRQRAVAMMYDLNLKKAVENLLRAEALSTSTLLTNITANAPADM